MADRVKDGENKEVNCSDLLVATSSAKLAPVYFMP